MAHAMKWLVVVLALVGLFVVSSDNAKAGGCGTGVAVRSFGYGHCGTGYCPPVVSAFPSYYAAPVATAYSYPVQAAYAAPVVVNSYAYQPYAVSSYAPVVSAYPYSYCAPAVSAVKVFGGHCGTGTAGFRSVRVR